MVAVSPFMLDTASGQLAPTWDPHTKKPLEKYDDSPAYIYLLETSPRMISPHGAFTSYQVNVDANNVDMFLRIQVETRFPLSP
ncbi:MAG: hypothetical protein DME89_09610 [Verrucomicrobia bacterium]|nr:MAG: hypothetical protein DME89_09610 [Verrucomicrobiota bacterium]